MKSNWEEISEGIEKGEKQGLAKADNKGQKIDDELTDIVGRVLQKVDPEKITVNDITDFKYLADINSKLKEQSEENKGLAALPQLSTGKENIIENAVHVAYNTVKQDDGTVKQTKSISLDDIANMSPDDIAKLITDKEQFQNDENSKELM